MGDFGRLHRRLEKIERDLQEAAMNVTHSDPRDEDMDIETMLVEKRSLEERVDLLQRELEQLECGGGGSERDRDIARTSSPGELVRPRAAAVGRARPAKGRRAPPPARRWSAERVNTCRCRCNSFFSENRNIAPDGSDRIVQQVQQDLDEAISQRQIMENKICNLEEDQEVHCNEQEELHGRLEQERERTLDMEENNMALKEQIQRLELELSNLPVGDCGSMREASVQITQLLQTLNEDMAKAPELCSRLRMAAQQIIDVEKRCANERGARSMDQQEVQFLRSENQRLREVAFRANMSAFQATVQLPQPQMMPGMAGMQGMDPMQGAQYQQGGQQGGRRKSMYQRMFKKNTDDPMTLPRGRDGGSAQFDSSMQRLSMAGQEGIEPSRSQMLNEDKQGGCCGK